MNMVVNTYKLENYAQRVNRLCSRISSVNSALRSVYWDLRSDEFSLYEASRVRSILNSNVLLNQRDILKRCISYLNETASDFECTELNVKRRIDFLERYSSFVPILSNVIDALPAPLVNNPPINIFFYQELIQCVIDYVENEEDSDNKDKVFEKILDVVVNGYEKDGSVVNGEIEGASEVLKVGVGGGLSGGLLNYEYGIKNNSSLKFKDENGDWDFDNFGLAAEAYVSGSVAKGEAHGNIGYLSGSASGELLTGSVSGKAELKIFDEGKFDPTLNLGAEAEVSVAHGEAELEFGSDIFGIGASAEGDLLHAEAEAGIGFGDLGLDKEGNQLYGVKAEAGAMACLAQGEISGDITIFGVEISVGTKGYAGAIGVEAGGTITQNGFKGNVGAAALIGGELELEVDWSGAVENFEEISNGVANAVDNVKDAVGNIAENVSNTLDNAKDAIGESFFEFKNKISSGWYGW